MGLLLNCSNGDFETKVLESNLPVLVDFSAPWCAPCRRLEPLLEEIASEKANELQVVQISVDESPELATRFGVQSVPTLMLFREGKPVDRVTGLVSKAKLLGRMESHLTTK